MTSPPIPVIVVAGPTASGKTAFAIDLGRRLQGEIVNIDSVQLYREADIGSAKATTEERNEIPHHCIDIRTPSESMDAREFAQLAELAIAEIVSRGRVPILVAGTTLYLKALLHGIADLPSADPVFRRGVESIPTQDLYADLELRDSRSAQRLHRNDRVRIIRALEILSQSSVSVEERRGSHGFQTSRYVGLMFVLWWDRKELHNRIARRVVAMLSQGLPEETERILSQYGDLARPLNTIGYRECVQALRGEIPHEQLEERITIATRRLAKQQSTFWKNEPRKRGWSESPPTPDSKIFTESGDDGRVTLPARAALTADEIVRLSREFLDSPPRTNQVWHVKMSA